MYTDAGTFLHFQREDFPQNYRHAGRTCVKARCKHEMVMNMGTGDELASDGPTLPPQMVTSVTASNDDCLDSAIERNRDGTSMI